MKYCPPVTIGVNSLWLPEDSPLLTDENVHKLFVEWRFLDLKPEESETPEALPKPAIAGQKINFNHFQSNCLLFMFNLLLLIIVCNVVCF